MLVTVNPRTELLEEAIVRCGSIVVDRMHADIRVSFRQVAKPTARLPAPQDHPPVDVGEAQVPEVLLLVVMLSCFVFIIC